MYVFFMIMFYCVHVYGQISEIKNYYYYYSLIEDPTGLFSPPPPLKVLEKKWTLSVLPHVPPFTPRSDRWNFSCSFLLQFILTIDA